MTAAPLLTGQVACAAGVSEETVAREAASKPARDCYPLADVVHGVAETVRTMRVGDYEVWNGAKSVSIKELAAV
jgi:hypothetical protein